MVKFKINKASVVVEYEATIQGGTWVWEEIKKRGEVEISKVFTFERGDLLEEPDDADEHEIDSFTYRFSLARGGRNYYRIAGRKLDIENDVWIARTGIDWRRKLFVAERDISIFKRIAKVISPDEPIIVGGSHEDAIPAEVFKDLIKRFPNTYELNRYAEARVAGIIGEYIEPQRDFRGAYETYLSKRTARRERASLRADELIETEIEKFELVRETLRTWLKAGDKSEEEWQSQLVAILLLIFPKYIAVLEKVPIEDRYTKPSRVTHRQIDLALVDVNGNIDIIEIKKPFADVLLRKTRYRDNYVPTAEFSGTIMQAEKYVFHLSKGGPASEEKLTKKFSAKLPPDFQIRITNPKAMLILGRDKNQDGSPAFNAAQLADLELIKRKYANMIDIITYDDLLRRLDNILASLRRRKDDGLDAIGEA